MSDIQASTAWFDPVAFYLGPLPIRWYALAYLSCIFYGFAYAKYRYFPRHQLSLDDLDPLMNHLVIGLLLGGRLGHFLFYHQSVFFTDPLLILKIWQGGMSFHGALIGIGVALLMFSWRYRYNYWLLTDFVCLVAPFGIFWGRLANFINGELVGRVTDVSWGVIFPHIDHLPRHPSQLYEAGTEGLFLFIVLNLFDKKKPTPGIISASFLMMYGLIRYWMQMYRVPEYLTNGPILGMDTGQILSVLMVSFGLVLLVRLKYKQ